MATERPPRVMDAFAQRFWEFTRQRELRLQRCGECGRFRWPPGPVCDGCISEDYEWAEVSGRATLLSWVIYHRPYFPQYPAPHTVLMVELDEGPRMMTNLVEVEPTPEALPVDLPLEIVYDDVTDEVTLAKFRPARG